MSLIAFAVGFMVGGTVGAVTVALLAAHGGREKGEGPNTASEGETNP